MILSDTIKPLLGGVFICTLPTVFLLVTLCGCSDSVSPLSGIYSESSTDEVIHICTDHSFLYFVDGEAVSGVYEQLNDSTLTFYWQDGSDTLDVDTFTFSETENQMFRVSLK